MFLFIGGNSMFLNRNKGSSHSIRYVKCLIWCLVIIGLALILFVFSGSEDAEADTVVSGAVSDQLTGPWTNIGSPYWVEGDIWVPGTISPPGNPDNTLTIDGALGPVDIRFNGSYSFSVGQSTGNPATLKANSNGRDIYFRSNRTGVLWQGIEFTTDASSPIPNDSILEGALIENISGGADTAVWLNGASNVIVSNCEIRNVAGGIEGYGVLLFNGAISTDNNFVLGNRISDITSPLNNYGIYMERADGNEITGNTIENVDSSGGGTSWGIRLWDSSINMLSLNEIRNITSSGDDVLGIELFFDSDGNDIIQNNVTNVTNNPGGAAMAFGIRLWGAPGFATPDNNNITGNTVRQIYSEQASSQGIMLWDEPTGNRISGNTITDIISGLLGFDAYGIEVINIYENIIENNSVCIMSTVKMT
jgi:parallel beta-helix repeat protein